MTIFSLNYGDLSPCGVVAESMKSLPNEQKLKILKSYAWGDRKKNLKTSKNLRHFDVSLSLVASDRTMDRARANPRRARCGHG